MYRPSHVALDPPPYRVVSAPLSPMAVDEDWRDLLSVPFFFFFFLNFEAVCPSVCSLKENIKLEEIRTKMLP